MSPSDVLFRRALRADLPAIVRMLAEDSLGATREEPSSPLPESYYMAFEVIDRDTNNELVVGLGLMERAIQRARDRGCRMVQLTSNKSRKDAIRFYESLGFVSSHEGLKLNL